MLIFDNAKKKLLLKCGELARYFMTKTCFLSRENLEKSFSTFTTTRQVQLHAVNTIEISFNSSSAGVSPGYRREEIVQRLRAKFHLHRVGNTQLLWALGVVNKNPTQAASQISPSQGNGVEISLGSYPAGLSSRCRQEEILLRLHYRFQLHRANRIENGLGANYHISASCGK